MLQTTIGQLVVNHGLPEDLRDYSRVLDKKGLEKLLQHVAEKYPDRYREIVQHLSTVGHRTAYMTGGHSFGPEHMQVSIAGKLAQRDLAQKVQEIYAKQGTSREEREKAVVDLLINSGDKLTSDVYKESLSEHNPLAMQVLSGFRGNATNLRTLRAGDLLYVDHHNRPIPIPILRSYSQGLTPAEYYAGTFGARKGVVDTKFAVQDAGFACLAEGTLVRMADGSTKPIESVSIGDQVLGADVTGHVFPVRVSGHFSNGVKEVWKYTFRDGKSREGRVYLEATEDHKVLAKMKRGRAGTIHGDKNSILTPTKLPLARASKGFRMVPVQGVTEHLFNFLRKDFLGLLPTYDIEVEHPDHLFVLANGMIVSNSKQFNQMTHRLVVSALDREEGEDDPGAHPRGLPVDADDPYNEGALLATDVGPYKRNTVLTPKILADIQARGHKRLLLRSPAVGGHPNGGLYARDLGYREKGTLPQIGELVGIAAAQALCLAKGTQVRMADGTTKAIETIEPGDHVFGCSKTGVLKPVRVVRRYDNGVRSVFETVFRLGTGASTVENMLKLRSTLSHKLLSVVVPSHAVDRRPNAAVRPVAKPENPHDRFYAKLSSSYDDTGHHTEPFALLLGLLIGDGCYTGGVTSNGISFSCHDDQLVRDVQKYVNKLGCRLVPQSTYGEYRVSSLTQGKCPQGGSLKGVRNPARASLLYYGLWGQRSHEKTLPSTSDWDNSSVAGLLAGLLATDGCVHVNKQGRVNVSFGSTSRALTEGVRQLLAWRFGVYTSALCESAKKLPDSSGRYRPSYIIQVSSWESVSRLADVINIPGVKGPRLRKALAAWPRSSTSAEAGRCAFVSQTYIGDQATFDIEVDHPDHLFLLANGLVVSNSEPLTQAQLSSKHSGGVAGASKGVSGFALLNQLVQVPKIFKGGASHAQQDGTVTNIRPAPQGGTYITIGNQAHYVAHGYEPKVKVGQEVEAGDVLSDGIANPMEAVNHKHIGEGRRYFTNAYIQACKDSGIQAHRRNVELLARGIIDHVRLDDEIGHNVPGDIVPYSRLEHHWEPRPGHKQVDVRNAKGLYLEKPALHYTIGTQLRPSVIKTLQEFGVNNVLAHHEPPPFRPVMIRGMENLAHDPDWMTRFLGSYLKKNFLQGVHRGDVSDEAGTSYVPGLARTVDFGKVGPVKPWQPTTPLPKPPTPAPSIMKQMTGDTSPSHAVLGQQKQAAEDIFKSFKVEYPAGTRRVLIDDDDDDDGYPLRSITYPVNYGSLPGFRGEDESDLDVLHGTDEKGESGSFKVYRPEAFRQETKFYHRLSPFEKDRVLRAFAPVLAGHPTVYKTPAELLAALEGFRVKPAAQ